MDRAATKEELIALISEGLRDVETAISEHPDETVMIYEKGKQSFLDGQATAEETVWSRASGFSLEELALAYRYLFASAFISAWYQTQKDKKMRDRATSPACLLVSGLLGFSPEDVLKRFIQYEQTWLKSIKCRWWFF